MKKEQIQICKTAQVRFRGGSPLVTASQNGYQKVVQVLLNKGADPNLPNGPGAAPGTSPLFIASHNSYQKVVQVLLNKGADPNLISPEGKSKGLSSLFIAIKMGHKDVVNTLLNNKAKPALFNSAGTRYEGYSPLFTASGFKNEDVVEALLAKGVDPNIPNSGGLHRGLRPLYIASQRGSKEAVSLLLEKNADPFLKMEEGSYSNFDSIDGAFQSKQSEILKVYIKYLKKKLEQDEENYLGIFFKKICRNSDVSVIESFFEVFKEDTDSKKNAFKNCLAPALENEDETILSYIIKHSHRIELLKDFSRLRKQGSKISKRAQERISSIENKTFEAAKNIQNFYRRKKEKQKIRRNRLLLQERITKLQAHVRGKLLRNRKKEFEQLRESIQDPSKNLEMKRVLEELEALSRELSPESLRVAKGSVNQYMGLNRVQDIRKDNEIIESKKKILKYEATIARLAQRIKELEKSQKKPSSISKYSNSATSFEGSSSKKIKVPPTFKIVNADKIMEKARKYNRVQVFESRLTAIKENPLNPSEGNHQIMIKAKNSKDTLHRVKVGNDHRLLYKVSKNKIVLIDLLNHEEYERMYE